LYSQGHHRRAFHLHHDLFVLSPTSFFVFFLRSNVDNFSYDLTNVFFDMSCCNIVLIYKDILIYQSYVLVFQEGHRRNRRRRQLLESLPWYPALRQLLRAHLFAQALPLALSFFYSFVDAPSPSSSSSSTAAAKDAEKYLGEEPLHEPGFSDDSFTEQQRSSAADENSSPSGTCIISPSLLRPFERVKPGTPSRSILRSGGKGLNGNGCGAIKCSRFAPGTPGGASARKKRERLAFSPYNQVKVIRSRHDIHSPYSDAEEL
jgi:hypothetical protein